MDILQNGLSGLVDIMLLGMFEKILIVKLSDNYNILSESEVVIEVELDLDEIDEEYNRIN